MKKILITGITGFVGRYLTEELLKLNERKLYGTTRSLVDRNDPLYSTVTLMNADLSERKDIENIISNVRPDEVYHLAALSSPAESIKNPSETITNNINGEVFLLEALKKVELTHTKVMILSSSDIYGMVDQNDLPLDEESPMRPANPYAVSKIAQDYLGLQYYLSYKMHILRVRPFPHIGPRQSDKFVLSTFAKQIALIEHGLQDPVVKHGNLESKRDFTDVRDMVKAYILLMEKGEAGQAYNIGSGKSTKIADALAILLSMAKVAIRDEDDPERMRPSDVPDLYSDNTKMHSLTGWKPEIPLEKSLEDILNYWRETVKKEE